MLLSAPPGGGADHKRTLVWQCCELGLLEVGTDVATAGALHDARACSTGWQHELFVLPNAAALSVAAGSSSSSSSSSSSMLQLDGAAVIFTIWGHRWCGRHDIQLRDARLCVGQLPGSAQQLCAIDARLAAGTGLLRAHKTRVEQERSQFVLQP